MKADGAATTFDLEAHWRDLLTVALLGTERRDPPTPPVGPLGDVVADAVRAEPSARMLADVAACAAVRRAAFVPGPAATRLAPPADDPRPLCPPAAVAAWRDAEERWPVLTDEWVLTVLAHGWRLPADVTVALLRSHRRDPVRRARVVRAAGPVAEWLLDHVPGLRGAGRSARSGTRTSDADPDADPDDVAALALALPDLPIPPELEPLVGADAHTFVARLLPGFHDGRVGAARQPVLVHLLARCRPAVLEPTAEALATVDRVSPSAGVAHALADLAITRHRLLSAVAPHG